ncbi:hypothetical protein [Feifania hominis]|uniref:Uncharacterized protein n=1 Tax=Feifania hominis TaxID=2763660 RepID=A0A926HU98_9FIRM|nr:hypothetical protein [Feifania hominis]MBC8536689.1 hypothetical protein [Feifania hominis]
METAAVQAWTPAAVAAPRQGFGTISPFAAREHSSILCVNDNSESVLEKTILLRYDECKQKALPRKENRKADGHLEKKLPKDVTVT